MNRKEIKRFKYRLKYRTKPFNDTEEYWYAQGCIDGMEAADNKPDATKLWHDSHEIPTKGCKVLCIPCLDVISLKKYPWDFYRKSFGITKWAYVNDLLPKRRYE